jgi:hypothetical protein
MVKIAATKKVQIGVAQSRHAAPRIVLIQSAMSRTGMDHFWQLHSLRKSLVRR